MATKLQKALTKIQGELEKLDPRSRAAIEKQLKVVQVELRKLLAGAGVKAQDPTW
jgi:ABC-type Zn uptake system ZnuABC Zn-binding protein ZnuA